MEQLADKGDGFVVYISEQRQARELFVRKLPANLVRPRLRRQGTGGLRPVHCGVVPLIGYENRALEDDEFRDDTGGRRRDRAGSFGDGALTS